MIYFNNLCDRIKTLLRFFDITNNMNYNICTFCIRLKIHRWGTVPFFFKLSTNFVIMSVHHELSVVILDSFDILLPNQTKCIYLKFLIKTKNV